MKKIIAITACVLLVTSGLATAAELASGSVTTTDALSIYGGSSTSDAASTTTSTLISKTSKGVKLGATYTTTGYAITTKHNSGNTAYGTANDATAIYKSEIGQSTALAAPSAASYTSFTTWTAM